MNRSGLWATVLCLLIGVATCVEAQALARVKYKGWNAYRLQNELVRLHVVAEACDTNGQVIATEILDANATPLAPIVIDHVLELPATASYVVLTLQDSEGKPIGAVTRCTLSKKPK